MTRSGEIADLVQRIASSLHFELWQTVILFQCDQSWGSFLS